MATITTFPIVEASIVLLREAFEGPSGPSTYFIDSDRKSGLFATLDGLTAKEASQPLGRGGASIAGHAFHVGFHLDASAAWIRGHREPRDWRRSWSVVAVSDAEWLDLKDRLSVRLQDFIRAVETVPLEVEELSTVLGAIAHAAYHLGAIRQRLAAERAVRAV